MLVYKYKLKALQCAGKTGSRSLVRDTEPSQDPHYWFARRSLRMWPIAGSQQSELRVSVGDFLQQKLQIPRAYLADSDVEEVRRIAETRRTFRSLRRNPVITHEVLVIFKDIQTRDMVLSYAPNLADCRESGPANKIGVRIEIPQHLRGIFNTLHNYGFTLREEHGADLKRHVKFDDHERTLFLSVRYPKETEWCRIEHDYALEMVKERERSGASEMKRRLGSVAEDPRLPAGNVLGRPASAPPGSTAKGIAGKTPMFRFDKEAIEKNRPQGSGR